MTTTKTLMYQEAVEAGERIQAQLLNNTNLVQTICQRIKQATPRFIVMVGRGSSDHASLFAKYLFEIETGLPVLHAAPSVVSVYEANLQLADALVIAISQSGQSPDIVNYLAMARAQGAMTLAIVNVTHSPLSKAAEYVLPLCVGEERAVAATKSYLGSLSVLLQLVATYKSSKELQDALTLLPGLLTRSCAQPAQLTTADLADVEHCVVVGRGFGYAIGMELALKLKETCAIHAECFSSAEFLHGPVRIVSDRFRILDIQVQDESHDTHQRQSQDLIERGAVMTTLSSPIPGAHPRLIPLLIMLRCYLDLETISRALGYNPDLPDGLAKVTETH
jgi:glucosamine--fructose-6-phosphate aminotransferase (isomerizing)